LFLKNKTKLAKSTGLEPKVSERDWVAPSLSQHHIIIKQNVTLGIGVFRLRVTRVCGENNQTLTSKTHWRTDDGVSENLVLSAAKCRVLVAIVGTSVCRALPVPSEGYCLSSCQNWLRQGCLATLGPFQPKLAVWETKCCSTQLKNCRLVV
jgi:hypothetical protein